jgi:hypothetical protein
MGFLIYMDKQHAIEIKKWATEAIRCLSRSLNADLQQDSPREFEKIKKGVASAIGTIQIHILEVINKEYSDLDDLRESAKSKRSGKTMAK